MARYSLDDLARTTTPATKPAVARFRKDKMGEIHPDIEQILITDDDIQAKVAELGKRVSDDYRGRDLLLVGVLQGAAMLIADISRTLSIHADLELMAASSYTSSTKTSGTVRIRKSLDLDISGRNVLVVDGIIDTGLTLAYLLKNLRTREPASLEICTLITKPNPHPAAPEIRYHGFTIPQAHVVGYGQDYKQRYRNLPYVGTLKPHIRHPDEHSTAGTGLPALLGPSARNAASQQRPVCQPTPPSDTPGRAQRAGPRKGTRPVDRISSGLDAGRIHP